MKFAQHEVRLPAMRRGCHLVTDKILKEIGSSLSGYKIGLANVFSDSSEACVKTRPASWEVMYDTSGLSAPQVYDTRPRSSRREPAEASKMA
ncbi:hypothetical protein TSOC_002922 [Tetrabaena socialis]|uniref:Uncharacterized protein n=1 Tax=Tetrabaena socialis TaxID=47790 RepID=A0A2J8ACU7_9CHLO|nr:hypothetical protein TSOC_002922 [Tetrabaena socialis]|eukprot:PNH10345.1 hypothetical protein TSOC_002922 [Tetrabaena socialis]